MPMIPQVHRQPCDSRGCSTSAPRCQGQHSPFLHGQRLKLHRRKAQPFHHSKCHRVLAATSQKTDFHQTKLQQDYAATASDAHVLQRPIKEQLQAHEVKNVFGFPRDLRDRYSIGHVLGAGSFGVVREVTRRANKRKYACKTIPKIPRRGTGTPRYLLKLQTEVDAMQQLGSSLDAAHLRDCFEDDESIHLVMELCEGGALLDRIKQGAPTERYIASIIRSVLRFIAQCHGKGIIYRDVKPDNFLFLTKEPDSPIRATDFGLSIRHWPDAGKLKSRSGTPVYMAPEVIMQEYGQEADEWSVGVLMYQLLTGSLPFWDSVQKLTLQQVWQAILVKRVDLDSPTVQNMMSEGARDLLKGLLRRNPRHRMTASAALEHPWIKSEGAAPDTPLSGSVIQRLQRHATYGALKQLVLQIIADDVIDVEHGSMHMVETLRDLFQQLDTDGSGGICLPELMDGLKRLGYVVTAEEVEKLMRRLDVNDSGTVEFEEFCAGMIDWKTLQEDHLWTRWVDLAFGKLDSNNDGYIDLDELIARLPSLTGVDNPESERMLAARRMLREADTNGDGIVSREEFETLLEANTVPDSLDAYDPRWLPEGSVPA
ncbi:hypothetical protein WJX73_001529 [Symbiochloris irregularis]|uniref:Uncharacterized protein n=1 Tax=Symbiochloris irregularis TaxID=706552 RepID=A0AAW1PZN7_9CHLO